SKYGDGGHRSHYLSHAKRPLYHLSYIPLELQLKSQDVEMVGIDPTTCRMLSDRSTI
ncbi:unnamed protein product, partial [Ascophyllum nodosum]